VYSTQETYHAVEEITPGYSYSGFTPIDALI